MNFPLRYNGAVIQRLVFAALSLLVATVPLLAWAHQLSPSFEGSNGRYIVDVGYDKLVPTVGQELLFDFGLRDGFATTTRIDFTDVWVRMYQNNRVILSTEIDQPSFGRASLDMIPVDAAPLVIDARFERGTTTLDETKFTLPVSRPASYALEVALLVFGFLLSLVVSFWFGKKLGKKGTK